MVHLIGALRVLFVRLTQVTQVTKDKLVTKVTLLMYFRSADWSPGLLGLRMSIGSHELWRLCRSNADMKIFISWTGYFRKSGQSCSNMNEKNKPNTNFVYWQGAFFHSCSLTLQNVKYRDSAKPFSGSRAWPSRKTRRKQNSRCSVSQAATRSAADNKIFFYTLKAAAVIETKTSVSLVWKKGIKIRLIILQK